jgi:hypothetical protein
MMIRAGEAQEGPLTIAKQRVAVELTFDGGEVMTGDVFLLPLISGRGGRERLIEVLADGDPFMPLAVDEGITLVRRDRIAVARVDNPQDAEIVDEEEAEDLRVVVLCEGGPEGRSVRVEGTLRRWPPPPASERLSDELNTAHPFLALIDGDGKALLIAKRHIVTVREI